MIFHNIVIILLVTWVAVAMSRQEDCDDWTYGNCDPGPNCENWNYTINGPRCFSCGDGGFWPLNFECDKMINCRNGRDEMNCGLQGCRSKRTSCVPKNHICFEKSDCCSKNCLPYRRWPGGICLDLHDPRPACIGNNKLCRRNFQCCSGFCSHSGMEWICKNK